MCQGAWGTQMVRKTELEFGLYSVGNRVPLKVLEQGTDLAEASFRSLSWQAASGRSQASIQVVVGGMQVWGRAPETSRPPPGALSNKGPMPGQDYYKVALPTPEGLSSLEGVHPFSVPLSDPSYLKMRGFIHCPCPSSSFGLTPPAPNFPGLGWEGIQSSLCGMTSPTGPPAE